MDGRTQYSRLRKMLESLKVKELFLTDLRSSIVMNIGSDKKTVDHALKMMFDLNMIKGIDNSKVRIILKEVKLYAGNVKF